MTNSPEPSGFAQPAAPVPWWWLCLDADGAVVQPSEGKQEFPTRSDAESWVGEFWEDLAEEGVAAVTLFEGEREVYGPMGLGA